VIKSSLISKKAIIAYFKSMRPYYFFVSGIAGWLGIVFSGANISIYRSILILSVVFLGWGLNQVINDLLGLQEDRINAPCRPLVSGELPIATAIIFSIVFFIVGGVATFILNPQALILFFLVFVLNMVYEYSKSLPVIGNIVFGILITPCLYYGAMCANGKGIEIIQDKSLLLLAVAVFLINFSLCFFTYYKDYKGDKVAGKNTLVVLMTPDKAKYLNFVISLLPFLVLPFLIFSPNWYNQINLCFIVLNLIAFIVMQYTAFLFFKYTQGDKTYYSLKWNFTGAVLFQTSFIALVNPLLASILYLISFLSVTFLFDMHKNHLA